MTPEELRADIEARLQNFCPRDRAESTTRPARSRDRGGIATLEALYRRFGLNG